MFFDVLMELNSPPKDRLLHAYQSGATCIKWLKMVGNGWKWLEMVRFFLFILVGCSVGSVSDMIAVISTEMCIKY